MEFSRQKYWSELPFPTPRDLPNPGIEPYLLCFMHWQLDSLPLYLWVKEGAGKSGAWYC